MDGGGKAAAAAEPAVPGVSALLFADLGDLHALAASGADAGARGGKDVRSRATDAVTGSEQAFDDVYMDALTTEFADDIDAVRQGAGFVGTEDQIALFARCLQSSSSTLGVESRAVLMHVMAAGASQ